MNFNHNLNLNTNIRDNTLGGVLNVERGVSIFNTSSLITLPSRTYDTLSYKPYFSINDDVFSVDKNDVDDTLWSITSKNRKMLFETTDGVSTSSIDITPSSLVLNSKVVRVNAALYTYGVNSIDFHNVSNTVLSDNSLLINAYEKTNIDKLLTSKAICFQNNLPEGSLQKLEPSGASFNTSIIDVVEGITTVFIADNSGFNYALKEYQGYTLQLFDGITIRYFTIHAYVISTPSVILKINSTDFNIGDSPIGVIYNNLSNAIVFDDNKFSFLTLNTADIHPTGFNQFISDVIDYNDVDVKNIHANEVITNSITTNGFKQASDWFIDSDQSITYAALVLTEIYVKELDGVTDINLSNYGHISISIYSLSSFMPRGTYNLSFSDSTANGFDMSIDASITKGYMQTIGNVESDRYGYFYIKYVLGKLKIYFVLESGTFVDGDNLVFRYRIKANEKNSNTEFIYS